MNIGTFCVAVLFMDFAGTFSMWVVLSVYVFCVWNMLLLYACVESMDPYILSMFISVN